MSLLLTLLLWSMSLCPRGNTIISQWIHPSILPSCPGAPRATPKPRTLHPPWDETWPHAPFPLPGASKEPLASTRLTGRRFSLKSNPGERTQAWTARQIDGSTDSQVDMWGVDAWMHPGQFERTRRCPQGQAVNRACKCVILLWDDNFATSLNLIKPDSSTLSSFWLKFQNML